MARNAQDTDQAIFFSIGDIAGQFGVSPESLRNWERQRLIPPPCRTPGKHRRYTILHVRAVANLMGVSRTGEMQHA